MTCECTHSKRVQSVLYYYYIIFALCAAAVIETIAPEVYYLQYKVYHAKNCVLSCQISIIYYYTPTCINIMQYLGTYKILYVSATRNKHTAV